MPKPDKTVSFAALKQTLKKAGYALDTADITIAGRLIREADKWLLLNELSGQKFLLESVTFVKFNLEPDLSFEITGIWKNVGEAGAAQEVVELQSAKKVENTTKAKTVGLVKNTTGEKPVVRFLNASFVKSSPSSILEAENEIKKPLAPIRTTSPGLTVYQGGAITPRLYFIKQHLGNLEVYRHVLDISVSYTPTTKLQLEAEIPFSRTSFDDGASGGSGFGLGNVTLWGKYRFFRTVKTYGDRQAAFRFGLELPTGKKNAPNEQDVTAPAFVRQQLTPISGGFSPHFDVSFSQAGGRFIFGGNVEGILRTERSGFRLGNEIRVNTDFEYVLLPFDYAKPGRELFVILETSLVARNKGRLGGIKVPESSSTEFYISPGLQYAAAPRFVVEGSVQIPIFHNSGAQMLRTDYNFLLGVRYLF
ncbi:MAG: transporter [Acidobacteriota bacterium]|nr:transporter [Acidobacteriota bacterium]